MTEKTYNGGKIINKKDNLILTSPRNSQDMNYHAYDTERDLDFLIDIGGVVDTEEDIEEYGGIMFSELIELDSDVIMENTWRILDRDGENVTEEFKIF